MINLNHISLLPVRCFLLTNHVVWMIVVLAKPEMNLTAFLSTCLPSCLFLFGQVATYFFTIDKDYLNSLSWLIARTVTIVVGNVCLIIGIVLLKKLLVVAWFTFFITMLVETIFSCKVNPAHCKWLNPYERI